MNLHRLGKLEFEILTSSSLCLCLIVFQEFTLDSTPLPPRVEVLELQCGL
jgi:hypothetical protein